MFRYQQSASNHADCSHFEQSLQKRLVSRQALKKPALITYALFALVLSMFVSSSATFVNGQTAGWDTMSSECQERLFPISSGGSKDEMVSCTLYDEQNGLIIVAGNSSSEDYAPAANDHAFAYAVDLDGNWQWGKFFYNVSFAVSTISGCQLDAKNNLVMFGQGDSKPVIMELNPQNGLIIKFTSLEMIGTTSDNQPWYKTFGGIYHDTNDQFETGKSFYYVAFVMNDFTQIMKIDSTPNPSTSNPPRHDVRWNYEYSDTSSDTNLNKKTPRFLHQDLNDRNRMYLLGRHRGKASVMKFDKQSAQVDWRLEINNGASDADTNIQSEMSDILSYVQPVGQRYLYACGFSFVDATTDSTNKRAVMFKVSDRGQMQYMYRWGEGLTDQPDNCRSITYDYSKNEVVLLVEATSPGLRPDYSKYSTYSSLNSDSVIIIMKDGGSVQYGYNINMYDASVSMLLSENSMFVLNNHYVFSGWSFGYNTKMQNVTYSITSPTYDTFLFKYNPNDYSCLYQTNIQSSELRSGSVFQSLNVGTYSKLYNRDSVFSSSFDNYFVYSSQYSGAFDLGDTMKYPRMCASESINMTGGNGTGGVQYYRGQHEKSYWIGRQSNASRALGKMDRGITWLFQNGTGAEGLIGRFDRNDKGGTIWVQTDSNDAIGKSRTILRGCSHFNKLYEVYLYIEVLSNTYPDFVSEIETSWTLDVNEVKSYPLPALNDKEGNDEPVVYIKAMDNQAYPPFLSYNNYSREITFRPDSVWYQGLTYYFSIVVKEKHSDTVLYPYYCTVNINGEEPNRLEGLNFTDITFKLTPITRNSSGAVIFSHPVNLTFVKENWDALFDVYIKNVTFRQHNTTWPLLDFEFTSLGGQYGNDSMTMNFTATFDDPYMLGLLVKKSDKLYVHMKYDLLDTYGFFKSDKQYFNGMVLGNVSLTRFMKEYCEKDQLEDKKNPLGSTKNRENMYDWKRIELQFDFRNDLMIYMREFAKKCYWYLLGVIVFQFFMLYFRDIGFLPLWTLIEYMQLCAFIPLYNFRLIPYLYDTFKPFLVSHLVLSNKAYILTDMEDDYFNINYDYYWLNVAKLAQALALMCTLFAVTVIVNIVFFVCWLVINREGKFGVWISKQLSQFRFNAYIRLYMLMYFDLTFFAVMKLVENNDSTPSRRMATIASYIIITLSFVVPFFLMSVVCKRFEVMKIKQAKASFNTVVLKIDKQSRFRLIVPGYFFFRRFLTAVLLSMPIDNTFIFLQYVFILMSSHAYVLYLVAVKPYQSPLLNNYVLSNETFYSALIIAIFIFSDATPELQIKVAAAVVLISSVFLLIFANLVMIIVLMCKGPAKLKEEIKTAKLKRAEKELIEEEEEEERRQRQQREEEEFTRLPEDTTNVNQYDLAAGETTTDMMKSKKRKDKKKSKKKNKNDNDDVQEFTSGVTQGNTSEMGNTTQGMLNETTEPMKGKKKKDKKKRKDKKKNKADDVQETNMQEKGSSNNESPTASSENKKKSSDGGTPNSSDNPQAKK